MTNLSKERVEELAVLVKRAYVGSKCRDKNWRDLLAILDDYADWLPAITAAEKADRSLLADIPDERGDT